ncbi:MAG: hypothetical protein JWR08_1824 [Enterovirga sp.]|jgi:hypothetical protein|nr:hypothetical protein [Enterovirga sp.]
MTNFDLQIGEAKFDEFDAWFAQEHPTSSRRVLSFKPARNGGVVYRVHVSCRTMRVAESTQERWGLVS